MTHQDILYLTTIYEEGSFSRAADKLYISQSALSQSVRKLEKELGVNLFLRQGTHVEPTEACRLFVREGKKVLEAMEQLQMSMHVYARSNHAELKVGMPPFLIKNYLPYVLNRFEERYPDISIKIIEQSSNELERLALSGIIDLCVVHMPLYLPTLHAEPLFSSELLLAVPNSWSFCKTHPYYGLDHLTTVDLHALSNLSFAILRNSRINHVWGSLFKTAGFKPNIYQETAVWQNVLDFVKHGLCAGFIDEILINHEAAEDKISYYRIDCEDQMQKAVVAYMPEKQPTLNELRFIEVLREYAPITKRQKTAQET